MHKNVLTCSLVTYSYCAKYKRSRMKARAVDKSLLFLNKIQLFKNYQEASKCKKKNTLLNGTHFKEQ